jgi:hypothetical protein
VNAAHERSADGRPTVCPDHSPFEVALPFGQGGIEPLPGDHEEGRRSPLSCPLVAVRIYDRILAWHARALHTGGWSSSGRVAERSRLPSGSTPPSRTKPHAGASPTRPSGTTVPGGSTESNIDCNVYVPGWTAAVRRPPGDMPESRG